MFQQGADDIQSVTAALHKLIDGTKVLWDSPVGHISAAMGIGDRLNFFISNGRQPQFLKNCLKRPGCFIPNRNDLLLDHRVHTTIDLKIPLQNKVVIIVV